MSPARNYPEETFFPPGLDVSAAKKSLKSKKKRISKKNKSKSTNSPPSDSSDKSSSDQDVISIPEVSVKSGTSDKSGSDEDVILISQDSAEAVITSKKTQYSIFDISISEDSEDAANADSTENQEEQLSDGHDNDEIVKEPSDNVEDVSRQHIVEDSGDVNIHTNENQLSDDPDNDGEDDIMVSQDSEKSTTDEQIQDEDVNPADMEAVGSDNEYERQENYLCVQCMTYFWSKEELDKHEISTHLSYYPQEENFPDVSGNENIETDDDEANSCTKSSTDQASEENIAKDSSDEESKESVIIDLTSTKGEGISDIESNSGNDGNNNSVNTFNGRDVSNDSVANETLHTEDCLEKLRHFLKLKYIKITLNSMSENACRIMCREYIRDSPEYKIILTEFLLSNEQCMDILRNRYDSYVFLWSGEELQHRQIDFPRHPLVPL